MLFRVLSALVSARDEETVCRVLAAGLAQAAACAWELAVCLSGPGGSLRPVALLSGESSVDLTEGGAPGGSGVHAAQGGSPGSPRPPAGALVEQVLRDRRPYLGPAGGRECWPLPEETGQVLVLPVAGRTGVRAVAIVGCRPGGAFSLAEMETCLLLAEQAGLALDNVRLITRLRETARRLREQKHGLSEAGHILAVQGRELAIVYRVAQETRAVLDLDVLLQRILNILHESLGPGFQYVVLLPDEATGDLVVRAVAGYPEEVVGFRVPRGQGVTGWAFRTGQMQVVDDCRQDPRYISVPTGANGSEVAIPLVAMEQVIGVLDVGSDTVAAFSEDDLQLLVAVAGHVADYIFVALKHRYATRAAVTDGCTGVYNYAYFYSRLKDEIARCRRQDTRLALVFLDIDQLKRVNDRFGHLAGNAVVRSVAEHVQSRVRAADVVARYGGDEFVIIMPDTGVREARLAMHRILGGLPCTVYVREREVPVPGISWGVSTFPDDGETPEELLGVADTRMYRQKGIEIQD